VLVLILVGVVFRRDGIAVDNAVPGLMSSSALPELKQVPGLDLEQAALDRGGTAQPS
jgi:hypothetical protein